MYSCIHILRPYFPSLAIQDLLYLFHHYLHYVISSFSSYRSLSCKEVRRRSESFSRLRSAKHLSGPVRLRLSDSQLAILSLQTEQ